MQVEEWPLRKGDSEREGESESEGKRESESEKERERVNDEDSERDGEGDSERGVCGKGLPRGSPRSWPVPWPADPGRSPQTPLPAARLRSGTAAPHCTHTMQRSTPLSIKELHPGKARCVFAWGGFPHMYWVV